MKPRIKLALGTALFQSGHQNAAGVLVVYAPPEIIGGTLEFQF